MRLTICIYRDILKDVDNIYARDFEMHKDAGFFVPCFCCVFFSTKINTIYKFKGE